MTPPKNQKPRQVHSLVSTPKGEGRRPNRVGHHVGCHPGVGHIRKAPTPFLLVSAPLRSGCRGKSGHDHDCRQIKPPVIVSGTPHYSNTLVSKDYLPSTLSRRRNSACVHDWRRALR